MILSGGSIGLFGVFEMFLYPNARAVRVDLKTTGGKRPNASGMRGIGGRSRRWKHNILSLWTGGYGMYIFDVVKGIGGSHC